MINFGNLPFGPSFSPTVSFTRSPELRRVLETYSDLIPASERDDVMGAYLLRKPMSSAEIFNKPDGRVRRLASELSHFFFVELHEYRGSGHGVFCGVVFVSRFRTLPRLAVDLVNRSQWHEDLQGVLYGEYGLTEVARYCQPIGLFK